MCGEDNSYGHPHSETIEKLNGLGTLVLRTDIDGTVTMTVQEGKIDYVTE